MKWGMQAFDTFKVVPPGHRHRAPGEPRVPGARRAQEGRHLLSRYAGRHRQPHHHDQRHRRGRLGRGRHRGRSRHARPAGVFPHPRRGRRAPQGSAARGLHGDRPGAHRHRAAAQGQGRRQVRRVLRRRHRQPRRPRSRHHRQHGARNTAPRWASSRWTRPPSSTSRAPAGPRTKSAHSKPISRRRACSACRRPDRSTTPAWSSSTSPPSPPRSPGPSARRTASRSAK